MNHCMSFSNYSSVVVTEQHNLSPSMSEHSHELFACLLDLKKEAIFGIDGQSIALKTDDFLGVCKLDDREFHLVVARGQPMSTLTSAFALYQEKKSFVRRYDPQTEEISSQPVDELTVENLTSQMPNLSSSSSSRVIGYSQIVSDSQAQQWKMQTNYVLSSNILGIRDIASGEKLIPGSYENNEDPLLPTDTHQKANQDGKSVAYPPIPVVDSNVSIWKTKHTGTKRYLHQISPSERTALFMSDSTPIANRLLQDVLHKYYNGSWQAILGDLQLAYISFLYLNCFSSLEHWKDLVAMICLVDPDGMRDQAEFYGALIQVLPSQISTFDQGFLEDMDEAGNNFLIPLLKQLCQNLSNSIVIKDENWTRFRSLLINRFPNSFSNNVSIIELDDSMMEDEDDEDAPIIVSTADVEASLARSSACSHHHQQTGIAMDIRRAYPLLVAAVMPQEDIIMTCARILDEKTDVSLVREAAAYLEEVEQRKYCY